MDALAPRVAALALTGCMAACTVVNPHYADDDTATAATSGAATAAATGDGAETLATTSNQSSTTSAGTGTGTSGGGTTSADAPGTTAATTGALTDATGTTGETTEAPTPPMRLQHYVDGQCELPLWCYGYPNIWDGSAARFYAQECFTGLTPPFRVTRIGYSIAATRGPPYDPAIALRGFDGVTPSVDPILPAVLLGPGDVTPGYHEVTLDFTVDADRFCIGVVGGDVGTDTGIGLAVDKVAPPLRQSFYRVNGLGQCNSGTSFLDIAVTTPNPTGQWCIDVDIQPL